MPSETALNLPSRTKPPWRRFAACLFAILLVWALAPRAVHAEYGDVVMNNYSDASGMRPVVFPHWFHRVRFRCKVCHADLGFEFKAGGNQINMVKIIDGQFCGACHNGELAWSSENCNLCHSGRPGTPTQVHESTLQRLRAAAPAASAPVAAAPPKGAAPPAAAPPAAAKK
jgi:c(7)-type cytochrome triheme protein